MVTCLKKYQSRCRDLVNSHTNIRTKLQSASTVTTPLFRIVNETKKPSSKFKQHAGITGFHSTDKFIEQLRSSCLGAWYTNMHHATAPNCSVRAMCFILFIPRVIGQAARDPRLGCSRSCRSSRADCVSADEATDSSCEL